MVHLTLCLCHATTVPLQTFICIVSCDVYLDLPLSPVVIVPDDSLFHYYTNAL